MLGKLTQLWFNKCKSKNPNQISINSYKHISSLGCTFNEIYIKYETKYAIYVVLYALRKKKTEQD